VAQLTDDCFAFPDPLMPLEQVEHLIATRIEPVDGVETCGLASARGRVLAHAVVAAADLPPFDNSAVDGYAVRHRDLAAAGETRLRIGARLMAGEAARRPIEAREAVRIFTGAPMPPGADTVFMQEDCREEMGAVILPEGLAMGANRRFAGEDVARGAVALPAGRRLVPADLALAAALGTTQVTVRRRVRAALFSTGDEIVEPGATLAPANIHDSNRVLIATLLQAAGARVTDLGILADRPDALTAALTEAARGHDLILTSGGVSRGEADHVRTAVEAAGRLVFWRVGIKPGRPIAMGIIPGDGGESAAFAGLPGNPVAAFVTFARIVRPLLLRLAGAAPQPLTTYPVRSTFTYKKRAGLREYVRVKLTRAEDGVLEAAKHPREGAGILTSLTETDGLAELADDVTRIEPGDTIGFVPYSALTG
jgi:molybdopterin molybdotransferase